MQAELFRLFKNAWNIFYPKSLKYKMIGALTTQTKPQRTEWNDFEVWWNHLSAQKKSEAMRDFRVSIATQGGWSLENANEMKEWDKHITVGDYFPLFRNIPRDPSLNGLFDNSWITLMKMKI